MRTGGESRQDRDREDFAKFSKFFTTRLIQGVVQSRLGQKLSTPCSPASAGNDWFNVRIEELGEVTSEIRAALNGRFPPEAPEVSLDFQLQTTEGEVLPLETWSIRFDSTQCDPKYGVKSHLYYQMSVLLRSAIAASRVTPTYRYYSRKQSSDSFIICYQLREGPPELDTLGDDAKSQRLGYLPCSFGTLYLNLHYRTKMVLSGREEEEPSSIKIHRQFSHKAVPVGSKGRNAKDDTVASSPQEDCFSNFSTSPPTSDAWPGPSPSHSRSPAARRPSVTFLLGSDGNQQASGSDCSSSGKGSIERSNGSTQSSGNEQEQMQNLRNNSSQGMFRMEDSNASGDCFFKPSSLPSEAVSKPKPNFPFAALLTASSAPAMAQRLSSQSLTGSALLGGEESTRKEQIAEQRKNSRARRERKTSLVETTSNPVAKCRSLEMEGVSGITEGMAKLGRSAMSPRRKSQSNRSDGGTPTKELDQNQGTDPQSNDNSPDRETVTPDKESSQIFSGEEEDSSDDSFVKIDICPLFGGSGEPLGSDLSDFVRECKTAPPQLRSFDYAEAVRLNQEEKRGRTDSDSDAAGGATSKRPYGGTASDSSSTVGSDGGTGPGSLECLPKELEKFKNLQSSFDDFIQSLAVSQSEDDVE